jgi:hypothetical protein
LSLGAAEIIIRPLLQFAHWDPPDLHLQASEQRMIYGTLDCRILIAKTANPNLSDIYLILVAACFQFWS